MENAGEKLNMSIIFLMICQVSVDSSQTPKLLNGINIIEVRPERKTVLSAALLTGRSLQSNGLLSGGSTKPSVKLKCCGFYPASSLSGGRAGGPDIC